MNITNKEFDELSSFVKSIYGINLTEKKKTLIVTRLNFIFTKYQVKNFSEYIEMIKGDKNGILVIEFLDKITTNHTFINREPIHFEYMLAVVLPFIEKIQDNNKDMRIWSAGCSNGSEAYTIAMNIYEYFGIKKKNWDTKILATDISEDILNKARKGIFNKEEIEKIQIGWQKKYFKKYDDSNYEIIDELKKEIIFRRFNLMNKFNFNKKFHLIFCRNVMIYFDNQTKVELINKFYESLEIGGYLFVGHSETIDKSITKFKYIMPAIYRKEV